MTDPLTGLHNRRLFAETFEKELNRARRYGQPLGLVTLDLHRFKEVNDRHGHPRGDDVLRAAAATLKKALRTSDSAFRIGGDEFALLLPQTDSPQALALCRRVETVFAEMLQTLQLAVTVGMDHGIAIFPQDAEQADQLIRIADERLYRLKQENHSKSGNGSSRSESPSAPDAPAAPAPQRAAPAPPPSTSVTADANVAQESGGVVAGNPSGKPYGETSEVAGSANSASTHTQFVPAKALNAAATPGSVAKTKRAYGMLGFVHWTISAAGKLQRRALDGTLTVVEPLSGAIIRAVAAEGIEVWAAGLQFAPTPKNVQPRSLLFHSSDAGESWKTIDGPWQGSIERVNLAGLGSLTVVTTDGTWSTGDGGKSWNRP